MRPLATDHIISHVIAQAKLGVERDGLYLYRHMLPASVPDLAFVGSEVATISNIATYHVQVLLWLPTAGSLSPMTGIMTGITPQMIHTRASWSG